MTSIVIGSRMIVNRASMLDDRDAMIIINLNRCR
jgi:hypothetical protein